MFRARAFTRTNYLRLRLRRRKAAAVTLAAGRNEQPHEQNVRF